MTRFLFQGLSLILTGCSAESNRLQDMVECQLFSDSFEFRSRDELGIQYFFGKAGTVGFAELGPLPLEEESQPSITRTFVTATRDFSVDKYEYRSTTGNPTVFFRVQDGNQALKIYDIDENWVRQMLDECE